MAYQSDSCRIFCFAHFALYCFRLWVRLNLDRPLQDLDTLACKLLLKLITQEWSHDAAAHISTAVTADEHKSISYVLDSVKQILVRLTASEIIAMHRGEAVMGRMQLLR